MYAYSYIVVFLCTNILIDEFLGELGGKEG